MERIRELIKKNKDIEFVVVCHNKEEFETLRDILVELGYEYALPLDTLYNMMNNFVEEDGYEGCWRINEYQGIAYNQSVEHWKRYYADIIEIKDGEFRFIDGEEIKTCYQQQIQNSYLD